VLNKKIRLLINTESALVVVLVQITYFCETEVLNIIYTIKKINIERDQTPISVFYCTIRFAS